MAEDRSNNHVMRGFRTLIYNSLDPVVMQAYEEVGIDEAHLNHGKALFAAVLDLEDVRVQEVEEERESSEVWKSAYETYRVAYMKVRKLVRPFAEETKGLVKTLHLEGRAPRKQIDLLRNAELTYKALLRHLDFLASLNVRKLNEATLRERIATAQELLELQEEYVRERTESQHATQNRNMKYYELRHFCRLLRVKALAALEDQPQQLEKLGLSSQ